MKLKAKRVEAGDKVVRLIISGRASFVDLIEPNEYQGKRNYQATILLPRESMTKECKAILEQAYRDTLEIGKTSKWGGKIPRKVESPIRNGDDKMEDNPDIYSAYEGCDYLVAKKVERLGRPTLFDKFGDPVTTDGVLKAGYWMAFDINFYPYNNDNNMGVAVGLNSVRLIKEDAAFGGGPSAESSKNEFDDLFGDEFAESQDDAGGLFD